MPPSGSAACFFARPEPPTGWGAVLAATLAASFVLLVFLPTVVYFFNSSFVEYTILEHYAVTLRLMRISPTSLHPRIFQNGVGMLKQLTPSHYTVDSLRGLESFAARARAGEGLPTFKFLHLLNTHHPVNIKRGVQSRQEAASDQGELQDTGALRYQGIPGRACLSEALVPLRSRLGDAPIGSRRNLDRAHEALYAGWGDKLQGGRVGEFLPLLLVKSPGSRGPLKISQAPASLIDVRATIL
jgi:hypothetical protein